MSQLATKLNSDSILLYKNFTDVIVAWCAEKIINFWIYFKDITFRVLKLSVLIIKNLESNSQMHS